MWSVILSLHALLNLMLHLDEIFLCFFPLSLGSSLYRRNRSTEHERLPRICESGFQITLVSNDS